MVRQAQAREKLLQKKLEAGLTPLPEKDPEYDWSFPDAGQLPVPVLSVENVSFNYPGGKELYSEVDFGVDLQTRVALVGPNGAGMSNCFCVGDTVSATYAKACVNAFYR
jgi:ATP-binding cassette, subfamily F, member 2